MRLLSAGLHARLLRPSKPRRSSAWRRASPPASKRVRILTPLLCDTVQLLIATPCAGAWAEYMAVKEEYAALAPSKISLSKVTGAVPLAALTAFQALEKADPQPGQRCLVHAGECVSACTQHLVARC